MAEPVRKRVKYENSEETGSDEVKYELFVVPWTNAAQFKKVYEYLFSPEVDKKRWALDEIAVWQTRCHPSLPCAIEASYGLTSAIVKDIIWRRGFTFNQQIDIQCVYSSAITRFVNLTVELHEQFGTMTNLAKGLGIPTYIIDLRNEASHAMMPSIPCLRLAAANAMQFLKTSYWDVENKKVENYIQKPIDSSEFVQTVANFVNLKLQLMVEGRNLREEIMRHGKNSETEALHFELKDILAKMSSCIKRDKRLLIKELISEGIFIPYDDDFRRFVSDEKFSEFQREESCTEFLTKFSDTIIYKVPVSHEDFWLEVIVLLNKHDAVPLFLELLLKTQSSRTTIGQKLLVSWVASILRVHTVGTRYEKSAMRSIFQRKAMLPDWKVLFYATVTNPCKYTAPLFPCLLSNLDVKDLLRRGISDRLVRLISICLGEATPEDLKVPKCAPIYTVEDILHARTLEKTKGGKIKVEGKGGSVKDIWTRVSDKTFRTWPIGHILNPIFEPEEQLEEDDVDEFLRKGDFVEKFIHVNNENDNEDVPIDRKIFDLEKPLDLEKAIQEIDKRKSFLYKI